MNYNNKSSICRVDFFNPASGKWKYTEAVDFEGFYNDLDGFEKVLLRHLSKDNGELRMSGLFAVCLEPYLEYQYPRARLIDDNLTKILNNENL